MKGINNNYNCEVEEIDYCDGLFVIFFRLGVFFLVYLVMWVLRLCLMMWIFVGLVLEIFWMIKYFLNDYIIV